MDKLDKDPKSVSSKALEVYTNSRVPLIKFKDLLLPPHGSMNRARRHFADAMASSDKLVSALAEERDFLCSYVEKQFVPPMKKGHCPPGGLQVPLRFFMLATHALQAHVLAPQESRGSSRGRPDVGEGMVW